MMSSSGAGQAAKLSFDELYSAATQGTAQTGQFNDQLAQNLRGIAELYKTADIRTLVPILPVLQLKGNPFQIHDYGPFEPLYKVTMPRRILYKCGRQVAKTTNMAAQAVITTAATANFNTLFVAPRYEQVRRVSALFVKPFIETSVIQHLLQDTSVDNSVLQKTFLNMASMFFSFALLDADRVRGLPCDKVNYDEVQDIDVDFVPVIHSTLDASRWGFEQFFGTPKTFDNTLEVLWEETSMAEWVVRCQSCNLENIPTIDHHLLKMIGPLGPSCAKCGKQLDMRSGRFIHANASIANVEAGYHVPQLALPMHYEDPEKPGARVDEPSEKWWEMLRKRDGYGGFTTAKFFNEVLGESHDEGVKLITVTDLKGASVLNKNERRAALDCLGRYRLIAMGVDWGGGGLDEISKTAVSIVGINSRTGRAECFYLKRFHIGYSHVQEAQELLELFQAFRCNYFAHDFGGSGDVRETVMVQAGMPLEMILPFVYVRASVKDMVSWTHPPSQHALRGYYSLDKARSLVIQAQCIKTGQLLLPDYESSRDITSDYLALIEDKRERPGAADMFLITRNAKKSDDAAHATNYACIALWHSERRYPDLSAAASIKLTPEQQAWAAPPNTTYE
jgi:hypothetical protein